MIPSDGAYDPRYLAGILLFNEHSFFDAHDVWEELWVVASGPERKFYQGLIQSAVGLYHFTNGNLGGALKLYRSSRAYMEPCGSPFLGLDAVEFWRQMERCFRGLLGPEAPDRSLRPDVTLLPSIRLDPEPATWPDPDDFLHDD